jgi:hypothetical protein
MKILPTHCLLLVVSIAAGCVTPIDPKPFQELKTSVTEIQTESESSLDLLGRWSVERYVDRVSADELKPDERRKLFFQIWMSTPKGQPFVLQTREEAGYFAKLPRFRAGMLSLLEEIHEYAAALERLASPEILAEADLDTMGKNLDGKLRVAWRNLKGDDLTKKEQDEAAMLSTAFTEAARILLNTKQRHAMAKALRAGQPIVDESARRAGDAILVMAEALDTEFGYRRDVLSQQFIEAKSVGDRKSTVKDLLDLNALMKRELGVLRTLDAAIQDLPEANRDLLVHAEHGGGLRSTWKVLSARARHLRELYKEIQAAQNPEPAPGNQ